MPNRRGGEAHDRLGGGGRRPPRAGMDEGGSLSTFTDRLFTFTECSLPSNSIPLWFDSKPELLRLVGWLVGWLADWWVGWLVG